MEKGNNVSTIQGRGYHSVQWCQSPYRSGSCHRQKAEAEISLQKIPEKSRNENALIFKEGFEKNGYEWEQLTRAQKDIIALFCESTDPVKFANFPLSKEDADSVFTQVDTMVEQTKPRVEDTSSRSHTNKQKVAESQNK